MPIIGNPLNSVAFLTDSFNGNGSTTAFTMSVAPATSSSILVVITGVTQAPSVYSVVGTTLTFSTAPPVGTASISVRYLGIPASGVTTTAYRTLTEFTATAGQTTFTPPSYTVGFIAVYQNGVMLGSTDYTATNGTTVVLAVGALVGDLISTESFYVSSVLNAIPATAGAVNSSYIASGAVTLTTQVSGILPVANGGTGLSAIPHTVQVFTSGSGTYTLPANCKAIWIRIVAAGGGGTGASAGGNTNGTTGGNSTFGGIITCNGGGGGIAGGYGQGGSSTGGNVNINGGEASAQGAAVANLYGMNGGASVFGSGGHGGTNGYGSGSGGNAYGSGGGSGGSGGTAQITSGGGAGGYSELTISLPSATYAYAIGAGGAGGTGTGAGGTGAGGAIIIMEYYV